MSDSIVTYALTNVNRRRVLGFAAVNRIPAIMDLAFCHDGGKSRSKPGRCRQCILIWSDIVCQVQFRSGHFALIES
jgi:hypothetical protein